MKCFFDLIIGTANMEQLPNKEFSLEQLAKEFNAPPGWVEAYKEFNKDIGCLVLPTAIVPYVPKEKATNNGPTKQEALLK